MYSDGTDNIERLSLFLDPNQCPHIWRPINKIKRRKDVIKMSEPYIDVKCQLCNMETEGFYYFDRDGVFVEKTKENKKYNENCGANDESLNIKELDLEFMLFSLIKRTDVITVNHNYNEEVKSFIFSIRFGLVIKGLERPRNFRVADFDKSQTMALQKAITKMMENINHAVS